FCSTARSLSTSALVFFFFSSRRRHTRFSRDWSSDVCSSDLSRLPWLQSTLQLQLQLQCRLSFPWLLLLFVIPAKAGTQRLSPRRSEERRVGKEWRARCATAHGKMKRYAVSSP